MGYKLLEGIRVLDLTMVYAGPMATKMLAELGAEIIKIESSVRADVFTRANIYPENEPGEDSWNRGCLFHSMNAGKRGISLNLGSEEGRDLFRRLVRISDVVIENFSPRVMDNWGLSYQELANIRPDIVMVSISGLGHYGPLRNFYMYVPGMEGMSGLTYNTGYPDKPPLQSGYAYGDWVTGVNAAAALLVALYHRKMTGQGQYIDVSGREAASCHIGDILMDYTLNGRDRTRAGNRHFSAAPHGCYRCKGEDNWVNIAVEDEEQWQKFCKVLGCPVWSRSKKFAVAQNRWQNQEELDQLIEQWTSQHDHYDVMHRLQQAGVPAGAVLNMKELYLDPHLVERNFFQVTDHGEGIGKRPLASHVPAKLTGIERSAQKRAPRFGQDNQYVFGELLGIPEDKLKKFEEEKVIGGIPAFPPGKPTRTNLIEKQQAGWLDPDYLDEIKRVYGRDIGKPENEPTCRDW